MDEIAIFDVLRRRFRLIAALCVVTALAGYGISFVSAVIPEKYDASAVVLVRPQRPIKVEPNASGKEFLDFPVAQSPVVETASKTYIQIIQSPALIREVVRELHLDEKTPKKEDAAATFWDRIFYNIKEFSDDAAASVKDVYTTVKYGRLLREDPFSKAVNDVRKWLVLKSYEDTYVFEIQYSNSDPARAADVANAVARLFIAFMEKMQSTEATTAADHLKHELEESRQRLEDAGERLREYKASHGIFLYQSEYDAKLKVISDLTVELAKLDESLAASQGTFEARTYTQRRERLLKILDEHRANLTVLPMIERELKLRQTDVDVATATYGAVSKELKAAEIKAYPVAEARLISPAFAPQLPSGPRRLLIVGTSFLAGLMAGVALAFFLEYINRKVRGIDDVEDITGLKVIGTIPLAPQRRAGLRAHRQ